MLSFLSPLSLAVVDEKIFGQIHIHEAIHPVFQNELNFFLRPKYFPKKYKTIHELQLFI